MLVLKIHNGPQAGKEIPLKEGTYVLGRSDNADIKIKSSQVSKKHAEVSVHGTRVFIKDLKSRNGTFINGLQIREEEVKSKDKITLHDIVITIKNNTTRISTQKNSPQIPFQNQGNLALDQNQYQEQAFGQNPSSSPSPAQAKPQLSAQDKIDNYLESVMLPGIYKLTEWLDFKWVLGLFLGVLILLVTVLSTIPAISLLTSSVEKESQRRALTIAKNIALVNKSPLSRGLYSAINLSSATNEAGVIKAMIVDADGSIIAPSSSTGKHPDIPFLHTARQNGKTDVKQINSSEIGAIVPVSTYNSQTGSQSVSAYAFVLYDMGSIAIDDGRTLSLYIQIFFISLIVGGILLYFLFKLFEYPIAQINSQLDKELQNPMGNISLKYNFNLVQKLISNINSSLTRSQADESPQVMSFDRTAEINNLVQIIGFPAIGVLHHNQSITAFNEIAGEILGFTHDSLGQNIDSLGDQALRLNLKDLIDQCIINPAGLVNNQLEIAGSQYDLMGQSVYGANDIEYFIISFIPQEEGE